MIAPHFHCAFAKALFAAPHEAPGPLAALTAQPAFAVYRNTVMKGCIDALEANFPTVARLVGRDWFRAAAAIHAAAQPPRDARLLFYGEGFAAFLEGFEPARKLPYLPGVARLDRAWIEAHAAPDAAIDLASFAGVAPAALAAAPVAPHPAARWHWFADQPVFTIWQRNRVGSEDRGEIAWRGEGALLTRPAGGVTWREASQAECAFLDACAGGAVLAQAAAAALRVEPGADLAQLLAGLLRAGALVRARAANHGDPP
ncbi:MAG: HvfC/BufC family peptide modification chaperone [Ramlibacter sp.]